MPGTTLPRGNILYTKLFSTTLTPAQVSANTTSEQTFTIQGLAVGDYINTNFAGSQTAGIFIANCRVVAVNTVSIGFGNSSGSGATPASGTYGFIWGRSENNPLPTDAS